MDLGANKGLEERGIVCHSKINQLPQWMTVCWKIQFFKVPLSPHGGYKRMIQLIITNYFPEVHLEMH